MARVSVVTPTNRKDVTHMAIKKKGGDEFAAHEPTESVAAPAAATKNRKPLTIAAIVGGGVLALGAAFGIGLAAGHAAPGLPGGAEFAAGAGPMAGHDGDRGGKHGGERGERGERGGQAGMHGPGQGMQGMQGTGDGNYCHPGDGHTHDANGNDVAPADAPEGFTCETGPAGTDTVTPAPSTTP